VLYPPASLGAQADGNVAPAPFRLLFFLLGPRGDMLEASLRNTDVAVSRGAAPEPASLSPIEQARRLRTDACAPKVR